MPITVVGVGAVDSTSLWAPAIAGPVLTNDIILIEVEQIGNEAGTAAASGFAHVLGSPVNVDTSTKLSVLWKRSPAGGETSASVTGPVDHAVTRTITIRGVKASGDPWNVSPTFAQDTAASATATWPAATSTVDGCLFVLCIATGRDFGTTGNMTTPVAANLTGIVEHMDNWVATGGGGGIGMASGFRPTAGALGTATATMGTTDAKALMTIVLEPAAAPAGGLPPRSRRMRSAPRRRRRASFS
jgi:hypothetical protein